MADPVQLDEVLEALGKLGQNTEEFSKKVKEAIALQDKENKTTKQSTTEFSKFYESVKKSRLQDEKSHKEILQRAAAGRKLAIEQEKESKEAINRFKKLKSELENQQKLYTQGSQTYNELGTEVAALDKNISLLNKSSAGSGMSLQTSFKKITVSGIDLVKGLKDFSTGLLSTSGVITGIQPTAQLLTGGLNAIGGAISGLSPQLGKFANIAIGPATVAIQILAGEAEKVTANFDMISKSGAVFTDGMTGMINTAHAAGLNVSQFGRLVQDNSSAFALIGGTVSAGAKKFANISAELDKNGGKLRTRLLNLGYTYQDQADGVVDFIKTMSQAGHAVDMRRMSDAQLAQQSADYLVSLKTITSVTGEEAKAAKERAAASALEPAIMAKLATMPADAAAKFKLAIAAMTPAQAELAKQQFIYGHAVTQSAAIMESTQPAVASYNQSLLAGVKDIGTTIPNMTKRVVAAQQTYGSQMVKQGLNVAQYLGQAALAGAGYAEEAKAAGDNVLAGQKMTSEAAAGAVKTTEEAGSTQDKLTVSLVHSQEAAQGFAVQMESIIQQNFLPKYAEIQNQVLSTMKSALTALSAMPGTTLATAGGVAALGTAATIATSKLLRMGGGGGGGLLGGLTKNVGSVGKLGLAGSVLGAGTAGFAAGTWLNEKFGLSDMIVNTLMGGKDEEVARMLNGGRPAGVGPTAVGSITHKPATPPISPTVPGMAPHPVATPPAPTTGSSPEYKVMMSLSSKLDVLISLTERQLSNSNKIVDNTM